MSRTGLLRNHIFSSSPHITEYLPSDFHLSALAPKAARLRLARLARSFRRILYILTLLLVPFLDTINVLEFVWNNLLSTTVFLANSPISKVVPQQLFHSLNYSNNRTRGLQIEAL